MAGEIPLQALTALGKEVGADPDGVTLGGQVVPGDVAEVSHFQRQVNEVSSS